MVLAAVNEGLRAAQELAAQKMGGATAGLDLGAIYHSHTRTEPKPSQTDINLAVMPGSGEQLWPGTLYVIVGVAGDEPEVKAYRIESAGVEEVALSVQ